jgi:pyruvate dehydrogenase E2 component (dihydrolipoamide acetyltransferase)
MPDVLMPRLSDTMEEGVLSQWLKKEGDQVHRGDVLAEIETDKATMDLEAYDEGVLQRLLVPEGATVPIGQPIAVIDGGTPAHPASPPAAPQPARSVPAPAAEPAPPRPPAPPTPDTSPGTARPAAPTQIRTSPLARRIARDHGIDMATIAGTGPGGRIVRADVEAAVAAAEGRPVSRPATGPALPPSKPTTATSASAEADDEEVPLTAVRRITARRLTESATAPHFYLTGVIDAGRLLAFRAEVNDRLAETGTKISVTDLVVRACAVALRAHPQVNSSWADDKILRHRRIHVGVAVALDDGLIVPVVRDADRKSLGEIAAEARALAERARAGRLTPDEFTGGTFTISNLGMYGVDHFTAVINPPEAAILAVGAATQEPVVRDGQLASRTTIKLTLSIDHRVLDGATAAGFLRDLKGILEEPLRLVI